MNRTEIKDQLKALKSAGHPIPALNAKTEVLEAALNQILATIAANAEKAIAPEPAPEVVPTPLATEETIAATAATIATEVQLSPLVKEMDFTPARSVWEVFSLRMTPDTKFVLEVVVMAIALAKFIAIKSAPHLMRAGEIALRGAVIAAVIFQVWILPKIKLVAYYLACEVLEVILWGKGKIKVKLLAYLVGCRVMEAAILIRAIVRRGKAIVA